MSETPLPRHAVRRLLEVGAPLPDEAESAPGLERYELGREIGRGGMGVVYEAHDKELDRRVALKLLSKPAGLSEAARSRFVREAKAAAKLSHPNIATVFDATPEYIAMQIVEGVTLAERDWPDARELAALSRDAALALHYAHEQGVVHRDLKPANLMIEDGARPHIYVMDFGLAKESAVDSSLSMSGNVLGTPRYMPPEQAKGDGGEVGPRSDVYSLGATMYHCLSGSAPFEGDDVYDVLRRTIEDEPRELRSIAPRVDRDLATIVMKCLAKEPDRRYGSALALASDLDRWLSGEPIQARPPSVGYRVSRFLSRRQGQLVAGLSAGALVGVVLIPFYLQEVAKRDAADRATELSRRVSAALYNARTYVQAGYNQSAYDTREKAIDYCRDYLDSTETAYAWYFLGRLQRAQGRDEAARVSIDRALELNPDLTDFRFERGMLAAAHFRDAKPTDPGVPLDPGLVTLKEAAIRDLSIVEAVTFDASATDFTPADVHFGKAQLAWLRGEEEDAVRMLKEVAEMDPSHHQSFLLLTRLYLEREDYDMAMRYSVRATDILRGFTPAARARETFDARGGAGADPNARLPTILMENAPEWVTDFDTVMRDRPSDATAFGHQGHIKMREAIAALRAKDRVETLRQLDLAIGEFSAALTVDESLAGAYLSRGVCQAMRDRVLSDAEAYGQATLARRAAIANYDEAIRQDPTLAAAYFDLALVYRRQADLARLGMRKQDMLNNIRLARVNTEQAIASSSEGSLERLTFERFLDDLPSED